MSVAVRPRPRLQGRTALLAGIVLLLAATGVVPAKQYFSQRARMAELEQKVELLAAERERLRAKVVRLQDPAELERLARECLGMVKPGEIAFVGVPESGSAPAPDC